MTMAKQFDYSTLPSANVANYDQMKGVGRYFSELKGNTNGSSSFWRDARVFTAIIYKNHKAKPVTHGQIQAWRATKEIPAKILKDFGKPKTPKQLTAKAKPTKNLNNITKDQLIQMVIALQEQQQSK
tara:strand:- start:29 stop:409 length:381 start_codon:yes stop_codon:yes gene_type:complete